MRNWKQLLNEDKIVRTAIFMVAVLILSSLIKMFL